MGLRVRASSRSTARARVRARTWARRRVWRRVWVIVSTMDAGTSGARSWVVDHPVVVIVVVVRAKNLINRVTVTVNPVVTLVPVSGDIFDDKPVYIVLIVEVPLARHSIRVHLVLANSTAVVIVATAVL